MGCAVNVQRRETAMELGILGGALDYIWISAEFQEDALSLAAATAAVSLSSGHFRLTDPCICSCLTFVVHGRRSSNI